MKLLKNITLNLILGLNVFILFFLLAEGRIVIPPTLQVLGRMHPLLLHFPIVLLFLALVFEVFNGYLNEDSTPSAVKDPGSSKTSPAGRNAVTLLLYGGALSAALTVVFGLILSKEEGYSGSTLNWHKWTGVVISLASALLIWYRQALLRGKEEDPSSGDNSARLRSNILRIGMGVVCLVLVIAGHLGASLTHGENFVFQPVTPDRSHQVDLATAVVFTDLVFPVLDDKCFSCHNPDKAKGELILTDTAGILAGGEDGALFTPGEPAESLLMERLLMDISHKHHMPPKNKPQLKPEEIGLIQAWIRSGGSFTLPLSALPPDDTLHVLARALYGAASREAIAEKYDFPPADVSKVAQLNNAYRAIAPLAKGSPALDVSFFNKDQFSAASLEEIKPVSQQVVQLNLSGMPLEDPQFALLKEFTNLRQLNLNYTSVTDQDLENIASLPHLRSLMLTGTDITPEGVASLLSLPKLRHLYVWNTAITPEQATQWTAENPSLVVETGYYDDGSTILPLNKPLMNPENAFFTEDFELTLSHPISGTQLRYTLDGSEPDSLNAMLYSEPMKISENTLVKVKAYKKGWMGSPTVQTYFYKTGFHPDSSRLETPPDPSYKARGAFSLFDLDDGSSDIRDGKWIGYRGRPLEAVLQFNKPIMLSNVSLSTFINTRAHLYPPFSIEVWGGGPGEEATLLTKKSVDPPKEHQPASKHIYDCPLEGRQVTHLRIVVTPLEKLPAWHDPNGNPAWIFVDEILLN